MIICNDIVDKFTIRNRKDLSIIRTVEHEYGNINCGLCYPDQTIVVLGIHNNLVEFDYDQMKFTKKVIANDSVLYRLVFHIERVNDDTFLTGESIGHI